jgi:hypothetical protein
MRRQNSSKALIRAGYVTGMAMSTSSLFVRHTGAAASFPPLGNRALMSPPIPGAVV